MAEVTYTIAAFDPDRGGYTLEVTGFTVRSVKGLAVHKVGRGCYRIDHLPTGRCVLPRSVDGEGIDPYEVGLRCSRRALVRAMRVAQEVWEPDWECVLEGMVLDSREWCEVVLGELGLGWDGRPGLAAGEARP